MHPSLRRLAKIPRFDSKRETYWYQRTLTRVAAILCKLIMRIEGVSGSGGVGGGGDHCISAADRLARRGVLVICIAIINLQELEPPPIGYHRMLRGAQKVRAPTSSHMEIVITYIFLLEVCDRCLASKVCVCTSQPSGSVR